MKKQLDLAKSEVASSKRVLFDITNKLEKAVKHKDLAHKKENDVQNNLEAAYIDSVYYEEEMLTKVDELNILVDSLKNEVSSHV